MTNTQRGIISLLKSAITGECCPLPEEFDLAEQIPFLKKQSIQALAYQGAYHCGVDPKSEPMARLFKSYYTLLVYHEKQMKALDRLYKAFEENGIDYMPLKGVNMKPLYPKPEMRTMGDADILIRKEQYERIVPAMESLGYHLADVDDKVYTWDSEDLHLELHQHMVETSLKNFSYYGTGWHLARHREGCRYALSPEDEFIFVFSHFARHFLIGGIGCRHVLDLYVCRQAWPGMDEAYIQAELQKQELLVFYRNVCRLLDVWFAGAPADPVTEEITDHIFSGGTFGDPRKRSLHWEVMGLLRDQPGKGMRVKLFLRAAFPPADYLYADYPVLRKAPWLLPGVWILRLARKLPQTQRLRKKAKLLGTMTQEDVRAQHRIMALMGMEYGKK